MTLNDIIVDALAQIDRGHDAQTLDMWRDKLTNFANDAAFDLSLQIKPVREEQCIVEGGIIDCLALERPCIRVVEIRQGNKTYPFDGANLPTGKIRVMGIEKGRVTVAYSFIPKKLSAPTDEPELPRLCHHLIVTYVVARERASGDVTTQKGGNVLFQLYYEGKSKLNKTLGGEGHSIINRW